jgi:NodT family efflux transporter outer membrane factor (OMF) lipoprotein
MNRIRLMAASCSAAGLLALQACSIVPPTDTPAIANAADIAKSLPVEYADTSPGEISSAVPWREFFVDEQLRELIQVALNNNQEQQILLQELAIARNEASARSGEYLPSATLGAGTGREKPGRYTREGAVEEQLDLREERPFPEPLPDYMVGIDVSWELDIWHQLRDAQKSAVLRYLATAEGQRFAQTRLVSEVARSYYELVVLNRKESIIREMNRIQQSALQTVRLQKEAGEATSLAVTRFEAELQHNLSTLYQVQQQVREAENRLKFLTGRFSTSVQPQTAELSTDVVDKVSTGKPAELLLRRPDIRRAELELAAAELDVKVARARFYPSLSLDASLGFNSAEAGLLFESPESLAYGIAADLAMPLFNRRGITAGYNSATAMQKQALIGYQQTILKAFIEVSNQLSMLDNLALSIAAKREQADALLQSVTIANRLYSSARADYMEVLLTQRDALDSRMELVELELDQVAALIRMYELLGGGVESPMPEAG